MEGEKAARQPRHRGSRGGTLDRQEVERLDHRLLGIVRQADAATAQPGPRGQRDAERQA
jgi:hypothetical protein